MMQEGQDSGSDVPVNPELVSRLAASPEVLDPETYLDSRLGQVGLLSDNSDSSVIGRDTSGETQTIVLPSLLERLEHSHTIHSHNYGERSVRDDLKEVRLKDPDSLTSEDKELQESVATLARFAGVSTLYQFIYTAAETNTLAEKLGVLSEKNRPDFDGVEGDLIDVCSALLRGDPSFYDGDARKIRGVVQRAVNDERGRSGMQFTTMVEVAGVANNILRNSFTSDDRQEYLIYVADPDKSKGMDLSEVYQFVVNYNAYQMLLMRSKRANELNEKVFEENCGIINAYFEEVSPALAGLPKDIKLEQEVRVFRTGRTATRRHSPKDFLLQLKAKMNERLANGRTGSGASKGYKLDPMAAYRLQRLIGHSIEAVNRLLNELPETEEARIIPLDELDLDED